MKKKLLFIPILIVFILVLTFSLVACNKASTQGLLANILNDHDYEEFVYDVFDSQQNMSVGTYTVSLKSYKSGSLTEFGGIDNVNKGILVKGKLAITSGTNAGTTINNATYFDIISGSSYMTPAYTSREKIVDGNTVFSLIGSYDGSTLNYTRIVNGNSSSGSIGNSGTYYDNNEFHQSLRTVTTFSTSFSFAFALPLVTESEAASVSLTAACSSTETVKYNNDANEATCYKVNISRSTEVAGVNQTLYYATNNISVNGWNVKNALIKIVEPFKSNETQYNMVYTLKTISLTPSTQAIYG